MASKRVLIIDDEADIREVARVSMQLVGGWEVLMAASGPEGIALAEREQPNVILLDMMMPEMDGPATLQQLRLNPATRDIPVIFLSAKVQGADGERGDVLRPSGFISKPFDPMTLSTEVEKQLQ